MVTYIPNSDQKIQSILEQYNSRERGNPELLVFEKPTHARLNLKQKIPDSLPVKILEEWQDPRAERIKDHLTETRKKAILSSPLIIVEGKDISYYALSPSEESHFYQGLWG